MESLNEAKIIETESRFEDTGDGMGGVEGELLFNVYRGFLFTVIRSLIGVVIVAQCCEPN